MKYLVTLTTKPGELPVGTQVELIKQPQNQFDNEAVAVHFNGRPVGFVAAYYKIRKPQTVSAGFLSGATRNKGIINAAVVSDQVAETEDV